MIEDESFLESRIENGSINPEDYRLLGKIYFDRGDYHKQLTIYGRALTLPLSNDERALILHEQGQANQFLGKNEDAILCLQKSLDLSISEEDPAMLDCSGMSCYSLSDLLDHEEKGAEYARRALEKFEMLMQKHPGYEEKQLIYPYMSELYRRFHEFDKALDSCKKALKTANNDEERMEILVGLGACYREKENYEKSEEAFRQALKLAKGKRHLSRINHEIGMMYFASNRTKDSIRAFNDSLKFIEFDPLLRCNNENTADIFWHLGVLYFDSKEYDRAIDCLEKALEGIEERHIYCCNTYITLGHCYFGKGEYNRARSYYDKALLSPLATKEEIDMANESLDEKEMGSGLDL